MVYKRKIPKCICGSTKIKSVPRQLCAACLSRLWRWKTLGDSNPLTLQCLCGSDKIFCKQHMLCNPCYQKLQRFCKQSLKGKRVISYENTVCVCGNRDVMVNRGICKACWGFLNYKHKHQLKKSTYEDTCYCGSTNIYVKSRGVCQSCYKIYRSIAKGRKLYSPAHGLKCRCGYKFSEYRQGSRICKTCSKILRKQSVSKQ